MLYPRANDQDLSGELFHNPSSEYRGTPFWSWNTKVTPELIEDQIDMLRQMGQGGFHIHSRTGLVNHYLSDEYMELCRLAVEKARQENMLAWLYDEDRWPSGAAGGLVTRHPEYRACYLLFTPRAYGEPGDTEGALRPAQGRGGNREENGELMAVYDVILRPDGTLASYTQCDADAIPQGVKWYAYRETAVPNPWFNNQTYVNTLSEAAIREFTRVTHERYKEYFREDFGGIIPAIFTDEPQHGFKTSLGFAHERKDVFLPWSPDLPDTYRNTYEEDLIAALPELIWNLPDDRAPTVRYRYHNHITERFCSAYCDTLGKWCDDNAIMLTGHVMLEPTLQSQTMAVGEAMRCYRAFDLPGIDILCDRHEYNSAKQCQSAVHQQGAPGMLSELYGVTGWDYDFRGHKLQGDWQAALGVTVRVPHLTWMSMKGEAKRDYPACIGYQSPWWKKYACIEDHFARVATAMTRGTPEVRIAVVHPIESFWLEWGPQEQTAIAREQMERHFAELTETLLFGALDFDFISEALLPELCPHAGNPFQVGRMAYDVVIVPALRTIRKSTLERLTAFQKAGGRLILLGGAPRYVDALPAGGQGVELWQCCEHISFERAAILEALEDVRVVDIRGESGARTNYLFHQLRRDGDSLWLFVAAGKNPPSPDVDLAETVHIELAGEYAPVLYDTLSGQTIPIAADYRGGKTIIARRWYMHDSLLLRLPCGRSKVAPMSVRMPAIPQLFLDKVPVRLEEPNAMVLDIAKFALDDGPYCPAEEILRADNICRRELGIPPRKRDVCQPYLVRDAAPQHSVRLRFRIRSELKVSGAKLALEEAELAVIHLNGALVTTKPDGWYVDREIQTVSLPLIKRGENILEINTPLSERTGLEWCYLLGDFGVRVEGAAKTVVAPVRELAFGSYVHQGLPFYTGNITYLLDIEAGGNISLRVPQYRGALIGVSVDGNEVGDIIFSPYTLRIPGIRVGRHQIGLTLYGTRQNGFAQLHHTSSVEFYQNPDSWRTSGDLWCYEYQLKDAGILKSPELTQE